MRNLARLLLAGLLGVGAAVLVACGTSGNGLIPLRSAGPLQSDFAAVEQAAQEGDGSCTKTEAAIHRTERDLQRLPTTVDSGLRGRLEEGVSNLSVRARELCTQPLASTTTTGTTSTTATPSTPSTTHTTETQSTPTTGTQATTTPTSTAPTSTATQPSGTPGGGTPAEGAGQAPGVGNGEGQPGEGGDGAAGAPGSREGGSSAGTGGTGGGQ